MPFTQFDLKKRKIFLTISGSQAYGTNLPDSDIDVRGIAVAPKSRYLGVEDSFNGADNLKIEDLLIEPPENVKDAKDVSILELRKFAKLAIKNNPNVLELLFIPSKYWVYFSPCWATLCENAGLFLSKKSKHTFSGYAVSQLKRIITHRNYLLNPPKKVPERKDFGLSDKNVLSRSELGAIDKLIDSELYGLQIPEDKELPSDLKDAINTHVHKLISELKMDSEEVSIAVAKKIGLEDSLVEVVKNERAYRSSLKQFRQYQSWAKNRNPKRKALEEKHGYDCYDAETEFLTENGWKKFDDISSEKLATLRIEGRKDIKWGTIEYQDFTHRFDSLYTGPMFHLVGNFVDTRVTANHNMLIQKEERASRKQHEWKLEPAVHLPDCFNIMARCTPRARPFQNPKEFQEVTSIKIKDLLKVIGWYLSDGCMAYRNGEPKEVRISQRPYGKLYNDMVRFSKKYGSTLNTYDRLPNTFNPNPSKETILIISQKDVVNFIQKYCGSKKNKRIPRFVFKTSKSMMEVLFDSMRKGDGTIRKHVTKTDSVIYYSKLKGLADDVNELAVHCGWETSLYGPYKSSRLQYPDSLMYQVHVRKNVPQTKNYVRSTVVREENVVGQRVVCFSVPNRTLITRFNGHISYHGNCKHAMHLVRLFRMGIEILKDKTLKVDRRGIDADELISIRQGAWKFDETMQFAKDKEEEMEKLYKTSTLQDRAKVKEIDKIIVSMVEKQYG